jgi:hypothetical protein
MVNYKSKGYIIHKTFTRGNQLMCQHLQFDIVRRSLGAIRKAKISLTDCVVFKRKRYYIYELEEGVDSLGNFMYRIRCQHEPYYPPIK